MKYIKNIIFIIFAILSTLIMIAYIKNNIHHKYLIINIILLISFIIILIFNASLLLKTKNTIIKIFHFILLFLMLYPLALTPFYMFFEYVMFPLEYIEEYSFPKNSTEKFINYIDLDGNYYCLDYKKEYILGFECKSNIVCTQNENYKYDYEQIYNKYFKDKEIKACNTNINFNSIEEMKIN